MFFRPVVFLCAGVSIFVISTLPAHAKPALAKGVPFEKYTLDQPEFLNVDETKTPAFERWDLKDFDIILPSGKTGAGTLSVMSHDQRFYFTRGIRTAEGNSKDKRLLANVVYQTADKEAS